MAAIERLNSNEPAANAVAVTPNDSTDLTYVSRGIYCGTAGNLAVIMAGNGATVTFVGLAAGSVLSVRASRVMATNTTITSIVNLF